MTGPTKRKCLRMSCIAAMALSLCLWAASVFLISTVEIESKKKDFSFWFIYLQGGQLFVRPPHQLCMIGILDAFILTQSDDYDFFIPDDIHKTFPHRYDGSYMQIAIPKASSFFETRFWTSRRFGFNRSKFMFGQCESLRYGMLGNYYVEFTIPIGWLTLATVAVGLLLLRRVRRYPRGHCQACGYNLTNNTTGTCPECGIATVATRST